MRVYKAVPAALLPSKQALKGRWWQRSKGFQAARNTVPQALCGQPLNICQDLPQCASHLVQARRGGHLTSVLRGGQVNRDCGCRDTHERARLEVTVASLTEL